MFHPIVTEILNALPEVACEQPALCMTDYARFRERLSRVDERRVFIELAFMALHMRQSRLVSFAKQLLDLARLGLATPPSAVVKVKNDGLAPARGGASLRNHGQR